MSQPNNPLINGYRYSFASIEIKFAGKRYIGLKSINYKSKQERGKVRGAQVPDMGRTRGKGSADCDFEMYRQEFQDFIEWLMLGNGSGPLVDAFTGVHDIFFDIEVKYAENGSPVVVDTIEAVTMDDLGLGGTEGTDASMVKATCSCQQIFLNGIPLFGPVDKAGVF